MKCCPVVGLYVDNAVVVVMRVPPPTYYIAPPNHIKACEGLHFMQL